MTVPAGLCTILNVAEHKEEKSRPDPSTPTFLFDVARILKQINGHEWEGFHGFIVGDFDDEKPGTALFLSYAEDESGRQILDGLLFLRDGITAESLRKIPVAALERKHNVDKVSAQLDEVLSKLPPLARTPGMTPEDFSGLVASHYKAWARVAANPASIMAELAGVPSPTMHTWIREARLRGFLPPASRKKEPRVVTTETIVAGVEADRVIRDRVIRDRAERDRILHDRTDQSALEKWLEAAKWRDRIADEARKANEDADRIADEARKIDEDRDRMVDEARKGTEK